MMATRNHAICRHLSEDVSRRPKMSAASIRRVAAEQSRIGRIPCNGEVRGGSRTTSGILPSTLCVECIPAAGGQRDAVGSLVIASRPPGSAGTAHRSRRRKMVSGTYSRDGGATVRFRRVREPESRRMRDRRLAIRARHPVVLLARADPEPRAAWWARTPTPISPRPRLPAVAPPHSKSGAPEPTSELPRMSRLSARPSHRLSAHLPGGLPAAATPRRTSGLSPLQPSGVAAARDQSSRAQRRTPTLATGRIRASGYDGVGEPDVRLSIAPLAAVATERERPVNLR
jgi:hypothetical protein